MLYSDGGAASPYGIAAHALSEEAARRTDNQLRIDRADAAALLGLRQKGMEIVDHPDRAAFRSAVQPLYTRWLPRIDPALRQQLNLD
jgi:TRAP-type C4-dicarboxylate transport system substrate-binding protein